MNQTEHRIQSAGVKLCRQAFPICNRLLFAVPNGGARDAITGKRLKDEGVTRGAWDLFLAVVNRFYLDKDESTYWCVTSGNMGLWIEVKDPKYRTRKNGGLTGDQVEFGDAVEKQGYTTRVCYSAQEIFDAVREYLG